MELTRQALIDKIQSKVTSIEDFNFDKLTAPPLYSLLTQYDIDNLYYIATSVKYSGKPKQKYDAIDAIMRPRGFVKLSAGTNRVVYRHLESTAFVVKVAADAIGIGDNPREFENQFIFKPFVTKVFEVSPCGTVGVFERVQPITSREEFLSAADDIYDVINDWFIGKYVMADIGTKFFMNWGIRTYSTGKEGSVAFGPVLLDFPYVYELDGNKLFCSAIDNTSETGHCGGVIDYDSGFNFLVCTKCGVRYRVRELAKKIKNNEIKIISNTGREIKKMKIGRYDKNGNIITDDGIKNPVTKVTVAPVQEKKVGTLGIDVSKLKSLGVKQPEVKKEVPKGNSLRSNPANNRGIVTAPASSNIKINLRPADEDKTTAVVDDNKEYNKLIEYNAEDNILVLSNGTKEITANLDTIPDDYKQCIIENSAEYTKYLESINQITELEGTIERLQTASDENYEKYTSETSALNSLLEAKDEEIANLKKDLENLDNTGVDIIEALKKKNEELEERLRDTKTSADKIVINGIPWAQNPEFVNITREEYGNDVSPLDGVVDKLKYYAQTESDINVIVFPTDDDEYMTNANGDIIAVTSINGYTIDQLMSKVDNSEIKVTEEAEDTTDGGDETAEENKE